MTAKTHAQLNSGDRKLICELHKSNKDLSQDKLTSLATEKTGKDLRWSTVTGILKGPQCNSAQTATSNISTGQHSKNP